MAEDFKEEFECGDLIEMSHSCSGAIKGKQYRLVIRAGYTSLWTNRGSSDKPVYGCSCKNFWKLIEKANKKESEGTMANTLNVNKTVAKVYEGIDDIILVSKHFPEIRENNIVDELVLRSNTEEVLARAKDLEKKEMDKK